MLDFFGREIVRPKESGISLRIAFFRMLLLVNKFTFANFLKLYKMFQERAIVGVFSDEEFCRVMPLLIVFQN